MSDNDDEKAVKIEQKDWSLGQPDVPPKSEPRPELDEVKKSGNTGQDAFIGVPP